MIPNRHQPKLCMSSCWPERGRKESHVILSAAKGLTRWAARSFAALRMTLPILIVKNHHCNQSKASSLILVIEGTNIRLTRYKANTIVWKH